MKHEETIRIFEVDIHNSKIDYYENLLIKFKEWNAIKREIKLATLLNGKKLQFDIEDIINHGKLWGIMIDSPIDYKLSIEDACFDIKSMSFILNGNNIEKLTIGITPLKTEKGKLLNNLIECNVDLKVSEMTVENSLYFYISY